MVEANGENLGEGEITGKPLFNLSRNWKTAF